MQEAEAISGREPLLCNYLHMSPTGQAHGLASLHLWSALASNTSTVPAAPEASTLMPDARLAFEAPPQVAQVFLEMLFARCKASAKEMTCLQGFPSDSKGPNSVLFSPAFGSGELEEIILGCQKGLL